MKLSEVLATMQQDALAASERDFQRIKDLEQDILEQLSRMGVLAVDGWEVRSNFPTAQSVSVAHPDLPNTVQVTMDPECVTALRAHSDGERRGLHDLCTIERLVTLMQRDPSTVKPETEQEPQLNCPIMSAGEGNAYALCCKQKCAWWHLNSCIVKQLIPRSSVI